MSVAINQFDKHKDTSLIIASENEHTEVFEFNLIFQDYSHYINVPRINAFFLSASKWGHPAVVDILLHKAYIDVNRTNDKGQTSLGLASENGHTVVVELLLKHPKINVVRVDWPNVKVRMLYLLYDKTNSIDKTAKELTWYTKIRSFDAPLHQSIVQHSELYKDLDNIIYEFACHSFAQIMDKIDYDAPLQRSIVQHFELGKDIDNLIYELM